MADSKTVLKWVGIGCGGVLLLAAAAGVAAYQFIVKPARARLAASGVDFSRGLQGLGGQAIDVALQGQSQFVLPLLPPEEVPAARAMYLRLHRKATGMRKEDIEAITQVLARYNARMDAHRKAHAPLPELKEDTRAFVAELGAVEARIPG